MKASWIVATHYRAHLLRHVLASIRANTYPVGWDHEVIVATNAGDAEALDVCNDRELGVTVALETRQPTGGGKRSAALRVASGDLVLVADDDDIQSPLRAQHAITAFSKGYSISELREFRYLHLDTGTVVRWCGNGDTNRAPVICGTARNYRRTMLQKVNGWKPLPRLIEKDIQARISARFPGRHSRALELGELAPELRDTTICLQHGANIWDDRPAPARGEVVERGAFRLIGEGHWRDVPTFPAHVAQRLKLA